MEIEIKDFEESDREKLRQIYLEVRQTNFNWLDQESFRLSSFDKDTEGEYILVAKVDNEIVGFTSLWLKDNFIHHLYISKPFQRKGIGTELLNRVIEKLGSNVSLKCLIKNELGINFYLKHGWQPIGKGRSIEGEYISFKY
ncbi:N-acetyltransferase [Arenibacter sp. N53]|uniref:GNAT family N-acetyltransferase n=1 Tax=Arenibacter TaxID=178469 RepID=UPI000CD4347B|nr:MULTISPECIES: GNAT family N-acetyltransferase [Arenibacter]MCM4153924.1 N-acetyltransferase [Arenibacter sp. N53]